MSISQTLSQTPCLLTLIASLLLGVSTLSCDQCKNTDITLAQIEELKEEILRLKDTHNKDRFDNIDSQLAEITAKLNPPATPSPAELEQIQKDLRNLQDEFNAFKKTPTPAVPTDQANLKRIEELEKKFATVDKQIQEANKKAEEAKDKANQAASALQSLKSELALKIRDAVNGALTISEQIKQAAEEAQRMAITKAQEAKDQATAAEQKAREAAEAQANVQQATAEAAAQAQYAKDQATAAEQKAKEAAEAQANAEKARDEAQRMLAESEEKVKTAIQEAIGKARQELQEATTKEKEKEHEAYEAMIAKLFEDIQALQIKTGIKADPNKKDFIKEFKKNLLGLFTKQP